MSATATATPRRIARRPAGWTAKRAWQTVVAYGEMQYDSAEGGLLHRAPYSTMIGVTTRTVGLAIWLCKPRSQPLGVN